MHRPVARLLSGFAATALACGAAQAQSFNVACVKGEDSRRIEIITPGAVGKSCDVQYAQGGVTRTPYHANNSLGFCETKANEIVGKLIAGGYACGQEGGPLTAEARPAPAPEPQQTAQAPAPAPTTASAPEPQQTQPQPAAPQPSEPETAPARPAQQSSAAAEPAPEPQPVQQTPPPAVVTPAASPAVNAAPAPQPAVQTGPSRQTPQAAQPSAAPEPVAPQIEETSLADVAAPPEEPAETLSEPTPSVATRGPAALQGDKLENVQRAAAPIPAGRLVGAEPEAEPAPEPAVERVAAAPSEPEAAPAVRRPTPRAGFRKPEDVILATLDAQAAAWNEGNLPAFMDIYWKDDSLKFVSGKTITKGWQTTMKRYRDRYADESGLGQLSFERTDVEMVTEDVAVVTGRFNHVKNDEQSSGVFSLVMRQDRGVWRIVHDHTAPDTP